MNRSIFFKRCVHISSRIPIQALMLLFLRAQLELPLALVAAIQVFMAIFDIHVGEIMNSKRIASILAIVCLTGCSALPTAQRISTTEATHSYVLSGNGSPTVILEAGLGDGKESWAPVYEQLSQLTQVFAYDRAGYGASKSKNALRDGKTIARELRATLQALNLDPPFILVGHSIGGTYMELYARLYPEEVAGVVLVDSRHADFTRQCQLASARSCTPPALLTALLPTTPKRELAAGDKTMTDVLQGASFPDVPLVVLTSSNKFLEGARFRDAWLQTQNALATLSSNSTHTVCKRCGHYIHKDEPKLVVAAVQSVLAQAQIGTGDKRP